MQRKKLWSLDSRFHCPVIGTCFTLEELRRLARKAGIGVGATMRDYELHHSFVQVVGNPVYASRLIHKWLDRKYVTTIRRFDAYGDARALGAGWDAAIQAGEVAGAFWALLTHVHADEALTARAYGDVHMLSHLAGHANHATRHEATMLKRRATELEAMLARSADAARARIQALERRSETLAARAQCLDARERELASAHERLAALESGAALVRLRAEKTLIAQELGRSLARAAQAEREAREWMGLALAHSAPAAAPADGEIAPAREKRCASTCDAATSGDCPGPDLCGRRILYVGGRDRQIAHFRDLVARRNGELLHHDGGLSESPTRLAALVQRADAVLCPVDCVSHDACLQVKHICKRAAKRFVPLRSASLAGFVEALREVTA